MTSGLEFASGQLRRGVSNLRFWPELPRVNRLPISIPSSMRQNLNKKKLPGFGTTGGGTADEKVHHGNHGWHFSRFRAPLRWVYDVETRSCFPARRQCLFSLCPIHLGHRPESRQPCLYLRH